MNLRSLPHNRGRSLEALIVASQTAARLTQVPHAMKRVRGDQFVPIRSSCDFFGCVKATGRLLVLDAKAGDGPYRLETRESHLPEHQRQQLLVYGVDGAVAGLLCEATHLRRIFWASWWLLGPRRPSIEWAEMLDVGPSTHVLDAYAWQRIVVATDLRREGASL